MYPDIRYRDWLFIDGVYNTAPDFEQSMPLRNAHVCEVMNARVSFKMEL